MKWGRCMSKYNKNSKKKNEEYYDGRFEIDRRIDAFRNGNPEPMELELTEFDLNIFIAILLERNNVKLIDKEMIQTIERVIKIQSDVKFNSNLPLMHKKYFIIDVIEYIKIAPMGYSYDREAFLVRLRERFGEVLKYQPIFEQIETDEFKLTMNVALECRNILSKAMRAYSSNYLDVVLANTLKQKQEGTFENSKKMADDLNYVVKRIAEFTTEAINVGVTNNDMGILITNDMSEESVKRVMTKLVDVSKPLLTSLKEMNMMIDGFYKKKLYLYAGIPNTGKTTTLGQFAVDCRKYNRAEDILINKDKKAIIVYFTMEDSEEDIANRTVGLSGLEQLRPSESTIEDLTNRFFEAHKNVQSDIGLLIKEYPGNTVTVDDMEVFLSKVETEYNAEIVAVFVDYIKRVKCTTKNSNDEFVLLGEISNQLRNTAFKFNCPVISAAQLNREAQKVIEDNINKEINDSAIKVGSSNIGSSFDLVANTDALALINSEYGKHSGTKYMAFKKLKMRYHPKYDIKYFASAITPMGGFVKDIDLPFITDNIKDVRYRQQFRSYPTILDAEQEFCRKNHINDRVSQDYNFNNDNKFVNDEQEDTLLDIIPINIA